MIAHNSVIYRSLRWAFQPVKHSRILVRDFNSYRRRPSVISDYMSKPGFKGLQIGSGSHLRPGWMNSDIAGTPGIDVALDIERRLPFHDKTLDAIYGSEVIEHIPRESVAKFFKEARRVLKSGGVLRLTTPDAKEVCKIYLGTSPVTLAEVTELWLEPESGPNYFINTMFRKWGHQWIWDFESMRDLMASCGFTKVDRVEPQMTNSNFPELQNLETRYGWPPPVHAFAGCMILEAS